MIMMAEQLHLLYSVDGPPRHSRLLHRGGHVIPKSGQSTGRCCYLTLRPCANSRAEAHQGSHGGQQKEDGNYCQLRHLTVAKVLDTAKPVLKFARTNFLPLGVEFSVTSHGGGHTSYILFGGLGNVDNHVGKLLR